MKKISILLLLMAFFAPLAMNGQNRSTLTVYDQNTTTNEYVPIYGYYADSKSMCEFIIPKEKISAMNGGVISAMKFYLDNSSSGSYYSDISATFNVFVKEVSATTLSGLLGQSGATTVFNSTITIAKGASNVEINIPFSSNYVYGGGNLLIGVYQTVTTGYNHTYWTGEAQNTNTAWGGYNGSTSAKQFLPKTTFTYEIVTTPTISLPATATVKTGLTTTLTATTMNVTGTPTITYSSNNPSVATVSGSGTTATVTGVSAGTATITATMTYNNNTYTSTCTVTVEDPSYCTPGPTSIDGSGISNVTFGTTSVVNDNLSMSGSPYYYNHSNKIGDAEAGSTVSMSITYVTNYTYYTWVWVDWNKDYEFDDTELVYPSSQTISSGVLSIQFNVPSSVTPGDYRMRIQGADGSSKKDPCFTGTYSYLVDYTLSVFAASNCKKPTGLAATNVTKNSAILNWTENGEATSWNISVNGATTPNITKPYPLNNLTPDTDYTVKVSPVCEDEVWSDEYTFHTDVACPAPTALTSTVTPNSASLTWTGSANDGFNVKYREILSSSEQTIFSDDFEGGDLSNWTTIRNGGGTTNTDWRYFNPANFENGPDAHSGTGVAMSRSWASSAYDVDNWLITPQVALDGTLSFWVMDDGEYHEHYDVYVSTASNAVADFTLLYSPGDASAEWDEVTVDLSSFGGVNGYIALRLTDYNQDFLLIDDFSIIRTISTYGSWSADIPAPNNSCTLSLQSDKDYEVQVQAVCGGNDGSSAWTSTTLHIPSACDAPIQLQADALHTTANVSWTGYQEEYTLQWRSAAHQETLLEQNFEDGTTGSWQFTSNNTANEMDASYGASISSDGAHNSANGLAFASYNQASDYNQYLISPEISSAATLTFYYKNYGSYEETFRVGYSTNGNSTSDFTWGSDITISTGSWTLFTENIPSGTKYLAINYKSSYQYWLYIDDIKVLGNEVPAGSWETRTIQNASSYEITGLTANTLYEWQVEGICTSNTTGYSQSTFTTLSNNQKVFMVAGNWDNASNWEGGIPTASDVAYIRKAATIPASYDAVANEITIQDGGSITIKDGGQLHSNNNVTATLEKDIAGYTSTKDNYYLIASPVPNVSTSNVENLLTGTFDFYYFDGNQELEWINHTPNTISTMGFGKGYLYANANQEGTTLKFTGSMLAQISNLYYLNGGSSGVLTFDESMEFGTFNLVGNPLPHNAYVYVGTVSSGVTFATDQYYYKINEDGRSDIIPSNEVVKAGEGVFVQATAANQYAFASSVNQMSKARGLNMNVTDGNKLIDRAVVNFGEGQGLSKFQMNPNHTKVYIPQNGKNYAVVYTEEQGEMPVNFKAEKNGTYTLSFTSEEISFGYLHLIDNMTGNDVDLLATPSYTFEAKTTDQEKRFKLVFASSCE